jgi:hypothetical protein
VTFLDLLARWQLCRTLEQKLAFLTWITGLERETPPLDTGEPARGVKLPVSPWFACCRALAAEGTIASAVAALCLPEVEALREAP